MASRRKRLIGSVKSELVKKSREAALAAVQIHNNPSITFKAETFIVMMNIAWTYLLHAYYKSQKIECRYYTQKTEGGRKTFDKTKHGAYKFWELERCLNQQSCPLDINTKNNLRFLIGLRHEIEHQMTSRIDDTLSARFQASALNYNDHLKRMFGKRHSLDHILSFSIQFSTLQTEQKDQLEQFKELPESIQTYIKTFDEGLTDEEFRSEKYAYRVLFVPKTANRKGQADKVIEFIKSDDPLAKSLNTEYALLKEVDKPKYLPGTIVEMMKAEGFSTFNIYQHTKLWKSMDARKPSKCFGKEVEGKWYWYQNWIDEVWSYCKQSSPSI